MSDLPPKSEEPYGKSIDGFHPPLWAVIVTLGLASFYGGGVSYQGGNAQIRIKTAGHAAKN